MALRATEAAIRKGEAMKLRFLVSLSFTLALCVSTFFVAFNAHATPVPQRHPAYLHALSDLRFARAYLKRPDGGDLRQQEADAIAEIDKAIDEIKKASIDDGKNLNDHPPVDAHLALVGRLQKALELLDKAHVDISKEEDNPANAGLQQRAMGHIDKAHKHVEEAIDSGQ
jgi:tetratricopeptide (TPR) repeat protein